MNYLHNSYLLDQFIVGCFIAMKHWHWTRLQC